MISKCVIVTLTSLTVSQYCVNGFYVGLTQGTRTPWNYAVSSAYTTKKSVYFEFKYLNHLISLCDYKSTLKKFMQRCIFLLHISKTTKPREFLKIIFYYLLTEGPGVARGKNRFLSPCHPSSGYPLVSLKT